MGQQVGPIPIPNPNPIQDRNQRSLSLKDGVRSRGKSFITKSPSGTKGSGGIWPNWMLIAGDLDLELA